MPLSPAQLLTLKEDLRALTAHWTILAMVVAGPGAIDPAALEQLEASGLLTPELASQIRSGELPQLLDDGLLTGILIQRMAEVGEQARDWTTAQWTDEIRRRPVALTPIERATLDGAKHGVGQYIQGLGNGIVDDVLGFVIEALDDERMRVLVGDDERRQRDLESIEAAVTAGVEGRKGTAWVKSKILDATNDGARDLDRIAVTETHNIHERGKASEIAKGHGPSARVFKRLSPGACEACRRAYMDGDKPRIFELRELAANGSNFGRKQRDWLPTLEGMHPWCVCELVRLPDGWGFDEDNNMVPLATQRPDPELPAPAGSTDDDSDEAREAA